ncbi:MAG: potassium channel family protein [Candidatus Bathyarchaeia archaeon]
MEELEYKPRSIRELLTEIKDLSELMIDLAYSSVLFNDRGLASEVLRLGEKVDSLRDQLNMENMLAVRDAEDAEMGVGIANVASAADKISDAAVDVAHIVIGKIRLHRSIGEMFEGSLERVGRSELSPKSILAGRSLNELQLPARIGVDVIAIRRGRRWIVNPEDESLKADDALIVRGSSDGINMFKKLAKGKVRKIE